MSALPLAVRLKTPKEPQSTGSIIPITIEVQNVSDRPVWMVGVLDGSELGLRYPHYQPSLASLDGPQSSPPSEPSPIPDMVAPLRLQDFRLLQPGETFDPTNSQAGSAYLPLNAFASFHPLNPGRYELRLTLSTNSQQDEEWLGIMGYPGEEKVLARLAEVPRLQIESNIALIEVR